MSQAAYIYSHAVDTSDIPCLFTPLPVRIHEKSPVFDAAHLNAITRYTRPGSKEYKDALCRYSIRYGNIYALCFPETNTEKIECLVYMLEYLYIHDDITEEMAFDDAQREHALLFQSLCDSTSETGCTVIDPSETCLHELKMRMLSLDPIGTPDFLDAIKQYIIGYDSTNQSFETVEDYIAYRIHNSGATVCWAVCQWGMGIRFTKEELDCVREFERAHGTLLGLTNDYLSWEREKKQPSDRICNAVPVLMQQYVIDEKQAMERLKDIVLDKAERFKTLRDELHKSGDPDIVRYTNALELHVGGIIYWSAACSRYNA